MLPILLIGGTAAGAYFFEDEFEDISDEFSKVFAKSLEWFVNVTSTLLGTFWKNLSPIKWAQKAFFGALNTMLKKEVLTFWISALLIIFSLIYVRRNL